MILIEYGRKKSEHFLASSTYRAPNSFIFAQRMESSKPIATSSSTPLQGSGGQPSSDRSKQQASAKAELPSSPSSGTLPVLPLVSSSPPASSPNLSTPSSQPPQSGPSKKATQEQKKVATSTIDVSSSLSALYKDLFETQKHADINVLVGLSRKKFTAHSIVLMVHSPVLEAMIVKNSQPTVKDVVRQFPAHIFYKFIIYDIIIVIAISFGRFSSPAPHSYLAIPLA